jgi:pimeloyl-ACP methyl ester carboxylesterase
MPPEQRALAVALLATACTASAAAPAPAPAPAPVAATIDHTLDGYASAAQRVDLGGGRSLNLRCTGSGAPTVLLDAGQGMTSMSWRKVQPLLATKRRVCSYDRAGLGFSDAGPMPRTAPAEAADLHALVQAAKLPTPLVLVGHSMASYIVRLYAAAHPDDVAGLVLVDPVAETLAADAPAVVAFEAKLGAENNAFGQHCLELAERGDLARGAAGSDGCVHPRYPGFSDALNASIRQRDLDPTYWRTALSERASDAANIAAVKAAKLPPAIPLVVLDADGTNDWMPPEQRALADKAYHLAHAKLASSTPNGRLVPVAHSSHNMQEDQPQAIVDAVLALGAR